jgi:hypothetical protein
VMVGTSCRNTHETTVEVTGPNHSWEERLALQEECRT